MNRQTILGLGGFVALFALFAPPLAFAQQGTVSIRVFDSAGRPSDGTVTLRGPGTASCRTVAGRCQLRLAPGRWTATLAPAREGAPPPRTLTVRSGATVALTLRTVVSAAPPATVQANPRTSVAARAGSRTRQSVPARVPARQAAPRVATQPTVAPRGTAAVTSHSSVVVPRGSVRVAPGLRPAPARPAGTSPSTQVASSSERPVAVRSAPAGRDLSRGRRLSAQVTLIDAQGRPTDATLTVRRSGAIVGTARSVAGRAALYDLSPGTYEVTATFARSRRARRRTLTIGSALARLTFRDR